MSDFWGGDSGGSGGFFGGGDPDRGLIINDPWGGDGGSGGGGSVIIGGGGGSKSGGSGGLPGILTGGGGTQNSQNSLLKLLGPLIATTGAAAIANLLNGRSGMKTSDIDAANAKRSAEYQKNFTKIPYMRRGLASLPTGYNPITQPDPPRFQVQFGQQAQPQAPMIPPAGTGGGYAAGGPMPHVSVPHNGFIQGHGAGMDDLVPARSGQQEIRLSDGEFVLPADIVSSIGDGSSAAGAKRLYQMMERIRKQKYGRATQPRPLPRQGGGILPG